MVEQAMKTPCQGVSLGDPGDEVDVVKNHIANALRVSFISRRCVISLKYFHLIIMVKSGMINRKLK